MTPDCFRECLGALRWTQRGLAAILRCDYRLTKRWGAGDEAIPASVAAWLETLANVHERCRRQGNGTGAGSELRAPDPQSAH